MIYKIYQNKGYIEIHVINIHFFTMRYIYQIITQKYEIRQTKKFILIGKLYILKNVRRFTHQV